MNRVNHSQSEQDFTVTLLEARVQLNLLQIHMSQFIPWVGRWPRVGVAWYTHEIFFISSDVRAASTSPAGSAAPGRAGRILMPLMVLCNQEPSAVYLCVLFKPYCQLCHAFKYRSKQAQVPRSGRWNSRCQLKILLEAFSSSPVFIYSLDI